MVSGSRGRGQPWPCSALCGRTSCREQMFRKVKGSPQGHVARKQQKQDRPSSFPIALAWCKGQAPLLGGGQMAEEWSPCVEPRGAQAEVLVVAEGGS